MFKNIWNGLTNAWRVNTSNFDPYFGYNSLGKAAISAGQASINSQKGYEALKNFSKNAEGVNIKPFLIAGTGVLALGTAGILAGPVAPGAAYVMKGVAGAALANPITTASAVTYLSFPDQIKGLGAIPKNYTTAGIKGVETGFLNLKGWVEGDQGVICKEVQDIFAASYEDSFILDTGNTDLIKSLGGCNINDSAFGEL